MPSSIRQNIQKLKNTYTRFNNSYNPTVIRLWMVILYSKGCIPDPPIYPVAHLAHFLFELHFCRCSNYFSTLHSVSFLYVLPIELINDFVSNGCVFTWMAWETKIFIVSGNMWQWTNIRQRLWREQTDEVLGLDTSSDLPSTNATWSVELLWHSKLCWRNKYSSHIYYSKKCQCSH